MLEHDTENRIPKWLQVVALVILAFALRAWHINSHGFTADEVSELDSARAPLGQIIADHDDDRFPPLYRVILALGLRASGTDLLARWLNVLLGVAAVVVMWRAGEQLLGEQAGLWPAVLLACCPFHIYYCQEGRAYALYFFLCAVATWAWLRLAHVSSTKSWCLLGLSSVAAIYTHYYAIPYIASVWLVVFLQPTVRTRWKQGATAAALTALCLIPAACMLWRVLQEPTQRKIVAAFDIEALGYAYMSLVTGFTIGPSMDELRTLPSAEGIRQFLPWIVIIGAILVVLSYQAMIWLRNSGMRLQLLFLLLALLPALGIAGNLFDVGFVYRYAIWVVIPFVLWLGAGAARIDTSRWAAAATIGLLGVNALALVNRHYNPRYVVEDFRAVAGYLEQTDPTHRPILVASPYMAQALGYYLNQEWQISSVPIFAEQEQQRTEALERFREPLAPGTRYWVLSHWLPTDDVRRATRDALLQSLSAQSHHSLNSMEIFEAQR